VNLQLDLVGIGALNVDYIVGRTNSKRLIESQPHQFKLLLHHFDRPSESPATTDEVDVILARMAGYEEPFLGGSAFNTIRAASALDSDLKLGFVGVLGEQQEARADFVQWFVDNHIDRQFVASLPEARQGVCPALYYNGKRRLRPFDGVNSHFSKVFEGKIEGLVEYLCRARIIHVSPFVDARSADLVAELIRGVDALQSGVIISFDPGALWTTQLSPNICTIYESAHIIFASEDEIRLLANDKVSAIDEKMILTIIRKFRVQNPKAIVIKRDAETLVFEFDGAEVQLFIEGIHDHLPADRIEDATGCGDIVAAAFLVGRVLTNLSTKLSLQLAHALMWEKLQVVGAGAHDTFRKVLLGISQLQEGKSRGDE
jgi:sugar/nucleoside kinase (ribokinase family)